MPIQIEDITPSASEANDYKLVRRGVGTFTMELVADTFSVAWGEITGTLSDQADLQTALDDKSPTNHTHVIADVTGLQAALDGKADTVHSHVIGDVTGLQTALDGKAALSHTHDISDISGSMAGFNAALTDGVFMFVGDPPSAHTHDLVDVTDVTISALNLNTLDDGVDTTLHFHAADRARANHTGTQASSTVTSGSGHAVMTRASASGGALTETTLALSTLLGRGDSGSVDEITLGTGLTMTGTVLSATGGGGGTWGSITGTLSSQTDLQSALDAKAAVSHTHTASEITDFSTAVAATASVTANTAKVTNATHTGDVTGSGALTIDKTAITGKSAVTADPADYVLISDASDSGNLKKALVSDFAGGGSDWTYVDLASDFTTSLSSAQIAMAFTPAANTRVEFEAKMILSSSVSGVAPRPGISWPTGLTYGAGWIQMPTGSTALSFRSGEQSTGATDLAATTTPGTGVEVFATVVGLIIVGGSPSGDVSVTLRSEVAATDVHMRAGSFIRYRVL